MPVEFKLPDLGEGIHEGEIIEVLVQAGDKVEDGQTVLIVETDKATAEVPSPVTGTVKEVRVKSGQTVRVGEVLIVFLKEGESEEQTKAPPPKTPEEKRETRLPEGPVAAAPSTRRLARELGIDINQVKPSGPGGRVTPDDVHAFAEGAGRPRGEKAPIEAKIPAGPPLGKGKEKKPPDSRGSGSPPIRLGRAGRANPASLCAPNHCETRCRCVVPNTPCYAHGRRGPYRTRSVPAQTQTAGRGAGRSFEPDGFRNKSRCGGTEKIPPIQFEHRYGI